MGPSVEERGGDPLQHHHSQVSMIVCHFQYWHHRHHSIRCYRSTNDYQKEAAPSLGKPIKKSNAANFLRT